MPKEDAETLAADIAAYLEYRKQCTSDTTDPTDNTDTTDNTENKSDINTVRAKRKTMCF